MDIVQQTFELVSIASPTCHEDELCQYLCRWLKEKCPGVPSLRQRNNLVVYPPHQPGKPTIGLIGHIDTVPPSPSQPLCLKDGCVYGCGSSDMKGGLALMMHALEHYADYEANLIGVFYDREEGPDAENGLRDLIDGLPAMDFALVFEPTNNLISAGCLGGMHATVTFKGKRSHSARPWLGLNAIYRAVPFLQKLREVPRKECQVHGLTFYEVISATQANTGNSANVIPDQFVLNVNARFAPGHTHHNALALLKEMVGELADIVVRDVCPPGDVCIAHPLIQDWIDTCDLKVEPKQAWTDLARLTGHGIPAVNFGPGDPTKAHQAEELVKVKALEEGQRLLDIFLSEICARHPADSLKGQLTIASEITEKKEDNNAASEIQEEELP